MILLVALAFAIDFTPRFDGDTVEAADPPSLDEDAAPRPVSTEPKVDARPVAFDEVRDSSHPWLDVPGLTLALAGEHGRRYYVVATAFVGRDQFHWQQGPYDAPDMTVPVSLELPAEVAAALVAAGAGQLSVELLHTDFSEESIRIDEPPLPVTLGLDGARVVGMARSAATYPLTTSEER